MQSQMSLSTFFLALLAIVVVGSIIGLISQKRGWNTMTPEESTKYWINRTGKRLEGSIALLVGMGIAAMVLRSPLVCQITNRGISNTHLFWGITIITAGLIMLGLWLYRKKYE